MRTGKPRQYRRLNSVILICSLVVVAAIVAVPFYSAQSSSLSTRSNPLSKSSEAAARPGKLSSLMSTSSAIGSWSSSFAPVQQSSPETITTFASDCTTPRTTFILGETVCAQTNFVSEPDRFVNWCVACPTIAYGGAGVTAIITNLPQNFLYTPTVVGTWKATIADPTDSSIIPTVFTVAAQTAPIATYAAGCVIPKTTFSLGEVMCAKTAGIGTSGFRFSWVDPGGFVERTVPITSDPQTDNFTLPTDLTTQHQDIIVQNVGTWRVNVITSRGSLRASAFFSVEDTHHDNVDLSIYISALTDLPTAGNPVQYLVRVVNGGPNDAANVHFKDENFVNATLSSVQQTGGLANTFTCPSGSTVDCSIASFPAGAAAEFLVTFTAGSAGATIDNSVKVRSTTTELNALDNDSSAPPLLIRTGGAPDACVLECPNNMTLSANATQAGQPGTFVTFGNAEAFGTCGAVTMNPVSGFFFPVGSTVVQATASGSSGCSFTITVVQADPPTISCQVDQFATASGSQSEVTVPVDNPTFTGSPNTGLQGVRSDGRPITDPYPIGVTTIVWTAKECNDPPACDDPNIRTASCTQHVTVTNPNAPTITCPSDKTFDGGSDCQKTLTAAQIGTPTAGPATGPNVPTVTVRRSDNLNLTDPYPAGQTVITWTATNDLGQVSCTQTITITSSGDTTPPTLNVPPDLSVTTNTCSALLDDELGVATASDNCSTVSITRTGVPTTPCPIPGNPTRTCETFVFPVGTTDVTYTARDAQGNTTVGVQHVTVHEPTPPTFTFVPASLTINTGAGATSCGAVVGDATLGTATVADGCDTTVIRTGVPAGNNFPLGDTVITYTAKADLSVTRTQTITVVDTTAPVVTAPAPVTLYTGAGATSCGVTVSDLDATFGVGTATDNCPGVGAVTRSGVPSGNDFPVGDTTLTYSATDAHGNTSSATQVVTVVDNTPPTITAPANVTAYTGPGATSCGTVVSDAILGNATASDNCPGLGPIVRTGVPSGNFFPVGTTTVTYTVTDAHNNTSSATQTVTVIDNTPPVITTNGQTLSMWPPNHKYQTFPLTNFVTGASDNCGGVTLDDVVIEKVTSDEIENGNGDGNTLNDIVIASNCKSVQLRSEREGNGNGRVYTITFKVTDTYGNVGRATAQVVVVHNPGETAVDSGVHYTVTGNCP